ncbi:MAG: bacteriocin [Hyphomicrobiales bacterium]
MTGYVSIFTKLGVITVLAVSVSACNLTRTERTVAKGGAIGAATGTGVAILAGGPLAAGALIGGAAGATSGAIFEQNKKRRR